MAEAHKKKCTIRYEKGLEKRMWVNFKIVAVM